MDDSKGNGDPRQGGDSSDEVLKRLQGFGAGDDGDSEEEEPAKNPPGPDGLNGNGNHKKVKRHPEDPPNALADAGEEVVSPEQIRIKAARLGITAQAVASDLFQRLSRRLYRAVHRVRAGAVVIPGQREAGEQLKIAAATEAAVHGIRAGGKADERKAEWIEKKAVPRTDQKLKKAEREVVEAKQRIKSSRRRVEELQEADERDGKVEGTTKVRRRFLERRTWGGKASVFGRISLTPEKALGVFIAEVIGTALVLSTKVADVFETSSLWEAWGIAVAMSLAILVASFVAAMAAAAIRLPGRVVGLVLVAIYGAVLFKFIPGLDALRESQTEGVQAMTATTLAACLVAGFTGYITATREDEREEIEERALKRTAGTQLSHALEELKEAEGDYAKGQELVERLEKELTQLWGRVEQLSDSAERTKVTAFERRRAGVEAKTEAATIEAIVATGVAQERAAADWAIEIARLAQEKTRLEEHPDETEIRLRIALEAAASERAGRRALTAMQRAAVAALGIGTLASLALGLVPLALGVGSAVILFLLDRQGGEPEPAPEPEVTEVRVESAASTETKGYRNQPEKTVAKTRAVPAKPSEHQSEGSQ